MIIIVRSYHYQQNPNDKIHSTLNRISNNITDNNTLNEWKYYEKSSNISNMEKLLFKQQKNYY